MIIVLISWYGMVWYDGGMKVSLALRIGVWKTDKDTEAKINFLTEVLSYHITTSHPPIILMLYMMVCYIVIGFMGW
jgi:hypothetical protein